jgi:hypothetical protein
MAPILKAPPTVREAVSAAGRGGSGTQALIGCALEWTGYALRWRAAAIALGALALGELVALVIR